MDRRQRKPEGALPSKYNIDALEESEILLINKDDFEMIFKTIPAFNDFVNATIKKHILVQQERIHTSITQTSEEKYNHFITGYPSIAQANDTKGCSG